MQETSTVVVRARRQEKGNLLAGMKSAIEKGLCIELLLLTATVLEGLWRIPLLISSTGSTVSRSPAHYLFAIGWQLPKRCMMLIVASLETEGKFVQGVNTMTIKAKTWLDHPCIVTAPKCKKHTP